MESNTLNNMLMSVDSAWLCAAERDIEREELERREALARRRRRQLTGKYELESASTQLDLELKRFQLERRKKAAHEREQRSLRALPPTSRAKHANSSSSSSSSNQLASPPAGAPTFLPGTTALNTHVKQQKRKPSVYAMENIRLAMLMRDKALHERVKKKKRRPRIVDDMLALEKRYAASATRLQRWWRACMRQAFWRSYFAKTQASVQIQRMARGMLCRRWVRAWHVHRAYRATQLQATFRGFYVRKVLRTWRQWEFMNVQKIQAIVRGFFGRRAAARRKRSVAALHIQMLWRGYASRKQSDMRWLARKAVNLQRLVRGVLARKVVRRLQRTRHSAATQIQRMFRGVRARAVVDTLLRDRETENRQELMRVLDVEEEWHRVQRDKLQARLERLQLYQVVCDLEERYYRQHERISDMESIYLDMQTQRLRVSPRAIEQGWVEEMEEKMKLQRAAITALKLDTIFKLGLELKRKEALLLKYQRRIRELEEKRARFATWREEEFLDYWERECLYQHALRVVEKRKRVADQRRKWAIKRFHTSGKPDQRWRCGKWSADVLEAAKTREIFCGANADLLAVIQSRWQKHMSGVQPKTDDVSETIREVDALTRQVALVATQAQIEQAQAIFDPVFHDIEQSCAAVQRQQRAHDKKRAAIVKTREQKLRALATDSTDVRKHENDASSPRSNASAQSREQRKRQLVQAAKIPWQLLDQIDAERKRLEDEKAMFKVWRKTHVSLTQRPSNGH